MDNTDFKPCSWHEIAELERQLGFNLPSMYRSILLKMGHGAGNFWAGEDCFYKHLPLIQTWAKELLIEDSFPISLPNDAFVFFMHQGYQFDFFRLSEGNNPPVYSYLEGQTEREFTKTYEKFTDFFCAEIDRYKVVWSTDDQEFVGLSSEFPSFSYLDEDRINAEKWHRKAVDSERIDKAIAEASELAQIEINGLRLLHKSQMQLLEAQQQNRRIKELYKKFFS